MKIVNNFQLKIVIFTAVKNRCILHGRVFVMPSTQRKRNDNKIRVIDRSCSLTKALRKHAQEINSDFSWQIFLFFIFAQNIDCGYSVRRF